MEKGSEVSPFDSPPEARGHVTSFELKPPYDLKLDILQVGSANAMRAASSDAKQLRQETASSASVKARSGSGGVDLRGGALERLAIWGGAAAWQDKTGGDQGVEIEGDATSAHAPGARLAGRATEGKPERGEDAVSEDPRLSLTKAKVSSAALM